MIFWREMAQKTEAEALTSGSGRGERETYHYAASSYRLKSNEEELFELVELSEVPLDKELFKVVLELLKLNVAPTTILQVLKTLRSQATQSSLPSSLQSSRASSRGHSPSRPMETPPLQKTRTTIDQHLTLPDLDRHPATPTDQGTTAVDQVTKPAVGQPDQQLLSQLAHRSLPPKGTRKSEHSSRKSGATHAHSHPDPSTRPTSRHKSSKQRTAQTKAGAQPAAQPKSQ